jgi:hypothetical protein
MYVGAPLFGKRLLRPIFVSELQHTTGEATPVEHMRMLFIMVLYFLPS